MRAAQVQYSEQETAAMLGIGIEDLRSLVRQHIAKSDETAIIDIPSYQASDLVMLRIFAGMSRHS